MPNIISDSIFDRNVIVRVLNESNPTTTVTNLDSVLADMAANPDRKNLVNQARYNLRRYGHATISNENENGVTSIEVTDQPEGWSYNPEQYGRSEKPFFQKMV